MAINVRRVVVMATELKFRELSQITDLDHGIPEYYLNTMQITLISPTVRYLMKERKVLASVLVGFSAPPIITW